MSIIIVIFVFKIQFLLKIFDMCENVTSKINFYESAINQMQPFSSEALLGLLSCEFSDMPDTLKNYFLAQREHDIVDSRRFRYDLYDSIPHLSEKLSVICKSLNTAFLKSRDIEIIDYTCSQGMSAIIMIEKLKNNGFDVSRLKRITIIDPIQQRLDNATYHLKAFLSQIEVCTICKMYYQVYPSDLELSSMYCIHIFGDIIEKYQYMPLSFAALLRSIRILFDCYIFYEDIRQNNTDKKLLPWSSKLINIILPDRVAEERKTDNYGCDWTFMIYGNHSLSNLFLPNSDDGPKSLVVDEYITNHITSLMALYYSNDLLPQTKPFDREDHISAFHETDLTIIEENFLIYKIAGLFSSDPKAFCSIVAKYNDLANKGCYEAYNNLGVIKIMSEYEGKEDESDQYILDEASKLFLIAAEHGSTNAMINLLSYYCGKNDNEHANYFIDQLIENNSDRGYWEKATSLFLGVHEPQNIELAKKYYNILLESIPDDGWPRGGYRNPAIFNLAKLDLEHPTTNALIKILCNLETCSRPSSEQEILKAVVLAKLGLGKYALKSLHELERNENRGGNEFVLYYNIAICYMYGIGCETDFKKAEKYFQKTLEKNLKEEPLYVRGYRGIGNLYLKFGKYEEARKYYSVALKYDKDFYCATRTNLSILDKEDRESVARGLLSSNNGCKSCHEANNYDEKRRLCPKCSLWLLSGKNNNEDTIDEEAKECLYESALQGYAAAQLKLGRSFINSDEKSAKHWLTLAAEQGEAEAQLLLYIIDKTHSNQAIKWLALSAKTLAEAQLMLHLEYLTSKIPGDTKEVFNWLAKAAINGSAKAAQYIVGSKLYDNGKKDFGLQLLIDAAKKNQAEATKWLEEKKQESIELRKKIANIQYANSKLTKVTKEEQLQHGPNNETGLIYSSDNKRLLFYFGLYDNAAYVKEDTICICDDCFNDRYNESDYNYLNTIYLPKSLKYIGQNAFNTYLTNIYSESEHFIIENSALFTKDKKVLIRYFGNDEYYSIPDGVEKLEGGALWARKLKRVDFPPSLSIINGNPFMTDEPDKFPIVSSNSLIISAEDGFVVDVIDKKIIAYLGRKPKITIPNGIKELGRDCFLGSEVESIYLPYSLSKVDESSFYQCFNLKEIHVPKGYKQRFLTFLPPYLTEYKVIEIFDDYVCEDGECESTAETKKMALKEDAKQVAKHLENNAVRCFYHFTDRKNLESIRSHGGLFSWAYCEKNGIKIPAPGGSSSSRSLDRRYHLEDYVRLSFCEDHPMAFRLQEEGADLVLLKIKTEVAVLKDTLFSDINATDNNHHHGGSIADLKMVDIPATKQSYVSKESSIFKKHQAEVLVKTHIPLDFIINIDNPLPL